MSDDKLPTISEVSLVATIAPDDIVVGLNNNDESILAFITEMLDLAESSELEDRLAERLKERKEGDGAAAVS